MLYAHPAHVKTFIFVLIETLILTMQLIPRTLKYLFLLIPFTSSVFGQLPTIKAVGGQGQNIDWAQEKKDTDPNGPGFFYDDCDMGLTPTKASSTLAQQGSHDYSIKNLNDEDPMTAWVAGGKGIGEWFEIRSIRVNHIYNGYQSSPQNWLNNSRVKTFKVYKNNKPICLLALTDEMGDQRFELPEDDEHAAMDTNIYKFEIVDIYKGAKWDDVCISEVQNTGCCFSDHTFINGNEDLISIPNLKNESDILTVDLETGKTSISKVKLVTTQKHLSLYKLSTATKTIELTIDHPLNFKNYGFTSIHKILQNLDTNSIINNLEVMTWNDKLKKVEYEKVTHLNKTEGVFDTYTILKIDIGNTYIANGFITKTY